MESSPSAAAFQNATETRISGNAQVITAGRDQIPGWREMQDELAALSADSTHIVANDAGHYVHLDAPELVIQAIRDMARKAGPD